MLACVDQLADAADLADSADVADLVLLVRPRRCVVELADQGEIVDVYRCRMDAEELVPNERRSGDNAVEAGAGVALEQGKGRRDEPARQGAKIGFAQQLARDILVGVENDRLAKAFQGQAGGEQFGVVQMIGVSVKAQCLVAHPASCGEDAFKPARQAADIGNGDALAHFVSQAVGNHQCDVVPMCSQGPALFDEDARVIAWMRGREMNDLSHE